MRALFLLALFLFAPSAWAATCTSKQNGNWSSSSTWDCGHTPTSADTVILASPFTVTWDTAGVAASLTVNSGATLSDTMGQTLTISGNLTNNGTITSSNSATMGVPGNSAVISGTGSFTGGVRLAISGTAPSIATGSNLIFSGTTRFYTGRDVAGTTVAGSTLTINGTVNASAQTGGTGTPFMRLYATNTIVGSAGVINAGTTGTIQFRSNGTLTNNGSVTLGSVTVSGATGTWKNNAATAGLTVNVAFTATVMDASVSGNTVTYVSPATPVTPLTTYWNLLGSGVTCPNSFKAAGSTPCVVAAGAGSVTASPTSCVDVSSPFTNNNNNQCSGDGCQNNFNNNYQTGIWYNPSNAYNLDKSYSTAYNLTANQGTDYLKCTGFNFAAVPTGATITGITAYVTRHTDGGTMRDAYVYLLKAGTILTNKNGATTTNYTTSDVTEAHGGTTSLWSNTWLDTDVKNSNFGLVFAAKNASTSTQNNIHTVSVDQVQLRVDYASTAVDHVAVSTPNTGSTCVVSNVTITAHTAAHAAPTSSPGTIKVSTSDNVGTWTRVNGTGTLTSLSNGQATYAYGTNETSVVLGLSHSTGGTITIGVADNASGSSLTSRTPSTELLNTILYSAGGFTVTDSAGVALSSAQLTQTAGTTSGTVYLKATSSTCNNAFTNTAKSIDMAFECLDPIACQTSQVVTIANASTNTNTALSIGLPQGSDPAAVASPYSYKAVSLNFNASSLAPFKITYPDVGSITLYFRYTTNSLLSESVPFVVKPAGFTLTNIKRTSDSFANPAASNASGTAFVKAGEAFSLTVTAVNSAGNATPNFGQEVTPESVLLTPALVANLGLTNLPAVNGTLGTFANGAASGTTFSWDEVGIITFTPSIADGDYLGVGNVTGNASANIGRFTLGKFSLQNSMLDNRADICNNRVLMSNSAVSCPLFNYMGERMDASFTLIPMSLNNIPLENYVGSTTATQNFGRFDPTVLANLNLAAIDTASVTTLTTRLSNSGLPAITCATTPCFQPSNGVGSTAQADVNVPLLMTRGTTPDGNYATLQVGIAPLDEGAPADALGSTTCNNTTVAPCYDMDANNDGTNDHALLDTTDMRYGQTLIQNGVGSELLAMSLPVTVQYWNAALSRYVTSTDDNISPVTIALANTNAWTTSLTQPTLQLGVGQIGLSAPGRNNTGYVSLSVSSPSYLPQAATSRATFGVFKGNKAFIYMRESY